jgi:hypothetical protein
MPSYCGAVDVSVLGGGMQWLTAFLTPLRRTRPPPAQHSSRTWTYGLLTSSSPRSRYQQASELLSQPLSNPFADPGRVCAPGRYPRSATQRQAGDPCAAAPQHRLPAAAQDIGMTAQSWGVALAHPDTVAPPSFARCWTWRCAPQARLLIGPGGATIDAGGDVFVADTGHITCRNS